MTAISYFAPVGWLAFFASHFQDVFLTPGEKMALVVRTGNATSSCYTTPPQINTGTTLLQTFFSIFCLLLFALSLDSSLPLFTAVLQAYETRVGDGFVMAGNEALVVCSLPAHTAQFLQVAAWITSEGVEISPSAAAPGQDTTRMRSIVVHYFLPHFQVWKGGRWPETRWAKIM
jgi:hypothetical protein